MFSSETFNPIFKSLSQWSQEETEKLAGLSQFLCFNVIDFKVLNIKALT